MTEKELFGKFSLLNRISRGKKEQILLYFATAPTWLLENMTVERLPANTTFVLEGHRASYVYFVAKGSVKAIDYRFPGVEYEFMQFNKVVYAMGGMELLLERKDYLTTLKTAVPCIMIRCEAEAFGRWLLQDIVALRYESKLMGDYLLEQGRMSRAYLFLPGPERLAQVLIHRYDAGEVGGILKTDGNQQILANETGFNIKTVARSMKTLTEEGLVSREGRKVLISPQQYKGLKELVSKVMDPEDPESSENK